VQGVVGLKDLGCLCAQLLRSSSAVNTTVHVSSDRLVTERSGSVDHTSIDWEAKLKDADLTSDDDSPWS
jgi:hypothetical protein